MCAGILVQYSQIQFAYWLLFYAIMVWWSLSYPFTYKKAKEEGRLNYILVATLLIGFIMPSLVLVLIVDGFYSTSIVFNACSARNPTHFYIVSTLHFSLVMYFCSMALLLNARALMKVRKIKVLGNKLYNVCFLLLNSNILKRDLIQQPGM